VHWSPGIGRGSLFLRAAIWSATAIWFSGLSPQEYRIDEYRLNYIKRINGLNAVRRLSDQ
jgi:hypothetical protein